MRKRQPGRFRIVGAVSAGFFAGAITVAAAVWGLPHLLPTPNVSDDPAEPRLTADRKDGPHEPPRSTMTNTPRIEAGPLAELRDRHLELPVRGAVKQELRDSFDERRGSTHAHEAIDILAPRNTQVVAVEDGTIARLFESKPGGTTVYQFDPSTKYEYYYAHLERYADGLREGDHVQRGAVLGYVGTSGNAPKNTPHLHFAIFRLTEEKQWWHGSPINPYDVLK
jgi:murein DD-endopeptidase MepM/ murein hydrolase activator NlpD